MTARELANSRTSSIGLAAKNPTNHSAKSSQPDTAAAALWQSLSTLLELQNQAPPLVPKPQQGNFPLSFPQQRLWFLTQLEPNSSAYNIPLAFRITGAINIPALEQSLDTIAQRHAALRTTFSVAEDGQPVQAIAPSLPSILSVVDLRVLPSPQREERARELATTEAQRPFNLNVGSLFRACLFQLRENEQLLLLCVHHIAFDGWSEGILLGELSALYNAFSTGNPSPPPELPIQYPDFADWQQQWLQGKLRQTLLDYWQGQLKDSLHPLQFPLDYPRSTTSSHRSASETLIFPQELTTALKSLSRRQGATLFATLLGAFQVLLHRYSEQEQFFICTPVANRQRQELKHLIGYFVNLLILPSNLSGNPSFSELLGRVRQQVSGALAHQDLPVQELVSHLGLSQIRLSQVMFVLQNTPKQHLKLGDLTAMPVEIEGGTADFDLFLSMVESEGTLTGVLKYDADLCDRTTIIRLLDRYRLLLEQIVANPEQPLAALLPLSETEREQLSVKKRNGLIQDTSSNQPRTYIAPRNSRERQLVSIWEQVLGIQPIGISDNFFALGGQSLLAMSLFVEIEKAFGKTLPLATLLQAPTIEQLAPLLRQEEESTSSFSSLVPIQPSGSKPPFFCVHGVLGNVLKFLDIANYLNPDQPFYGLQAKGLDGKCAPHSRIEAMAACYIQEMRSRQPEGPYFLGGYSMGGIVAYEMAQQLHAQGQKVALLVLFDTFGANCFERLTFREQHYLQYLLKLGWSESLHEELRQLYRRKLEKFACQVFLKLGRPLSHNLQRSFISQANKQAQRQYKPRVYPGRITLFRASEPPCFSFVDMPTHEDWHRRDPEHGWGSLAGGGLDIRNVPGHHHSMFKEPHLREIAQTLQVCLDEAQIEASHPCVSSSH